jgi:hypothetical protein
LHIDKIGIEAAGVIIIEMAQTQAIQECSLTALEIVKSVPGISNVIFEAERHPLPKI